MQKNIIFGVILIVGMSVSGTAVAIDGDFGSPYASGQQIPSGPRAPGEPPAYGGKDADIPSITLFGGALVLFGVAAAAWWHIKSVRPGRAAGTQ